MNLINIGDIVVFTVDKVLGDSYRGSIYKHGILQTLGIAVIKSDKLRNNSIGDGIKIVKIISLYVDMSVYETSEIDVSYDELLIFTKSCIGTSILSSK
jgi:hypothetical protein